MEESLIRLAEGHPGLLDKTGQLAIDNELDGATELHAILQSVESEVNDGEGRGD